jgi:hypothetical protein
MGSSPSKDLYYAARRGDVQGMEKAAAAGGDINARNSDKRQSTPLMAAAKHGHVAAVRWLLARGALDFRAEDGNSAMHEAARFGHERCVAILLDRGSDHFARNLVQKRAIDRAAEGGRVGVVRLIEARTCPFFADLELELDGWFSTYFEPRWATVHRARPHDNPQVDRGEVSLFLYASQDEPVPLLELLRPRLQPVRAEEKDLVVFDVVPETVRVQGGREGKVRPYRARLPRDTFTWLVNVLSPTFPTGRGPAFEGNTGLVFLPPPARAHVRKFAHLSLDFTAAPLPPALAHSQMALTAPQTPSLPQGGGAIVVPLGPPAGAAGVVGAGPVPAMLSGPSAAAATAAAAAPSMTSAAVGASTSASAAASAVSPSYLRGGVLELKRALEDGLLEFDVRIPEEYLCPITADLMFDPVVAADGHTYAREGISAWLKLKRTSPKTNEALQDDRLVPNHHLRGAILEWVDAHKIRTGAADAGAAAASAAATAGLAPSSTAAAAAGPAPALPHWNESEWHVVEKDEVAADAARAAQRMAREAGPAPGVVPVAVTPVMMGGAVRVGGPSLATAAQPMWMPQPALASSGYAPAAPAAQPGWRGAEGVGLGGDDGRFVAFPQVPVQQQPGMQQPLDWQQAALGNDPQPMGGPRRVAMASGV